jgi:hypothetical protein
MTPDSRQPRVPVCRFCGSDKGIDQMGYVRTSAWRKIQSVERGDDGKTTAKYGSIETERWGSYYGQDFDPDSFRCTECEAERATLDALIGDPAIFSPGALVVCPDGFRGTVDTVDFNARRLTVEGWHEEFKFGEVTVMGTAA